jgi:hypothetical protein
MRYFREIPDFRENPNNKSAYFDAFSNTYEWHSACLSNRAFWPQLTLWRRATQWLSKLAARREKKTIALHLCDGFIEWVKVMLQCPRR